MRNFTKYAMSLVALSVVGLGCGNSGESTTDQTKTAGATDKKDAKPDAKGGLTIAVIPKGTSHEFWKSVHAGAEDAAKELGATIIWKGPLKEDDLAGQIEVVDSFVSQKVSGIVLAPLDDKGLKTPVENAQKAGIPVNIIDSALKDTKTVSFVATDNFKGGQLAGEEMVKQLGGKGTVVVFRLMAGSASTTEREEGFISVIKKNPGIKILRDNQFLGATVEDAQKNSENALSSMKSGDKLGVDGIFTPNESTTFGTLRTLEDAKWAGKVKFIGFDASKDLIEGMKKGEINGLVVQNPRKMGYLGVKTLIQSIKGEKVDTKIDTGAALITPTNLETDEIKKLIAPPQ